MSHREGKKISIQKNNRILLFYKTKLINMMFYRFRILLKESFTIFHRQLLPYYFDIFFIFSIEFSSSKYGFIPSFLFFISNTPSPPLDILNNFLGINS